MVDTTRRQAVLPAPDPEPARPTPVPVRGATRRWVPRSIRVRLALSSAVVCGALVLLAGFGALQLLDHRLDADVASALRQRLAAAELVVSGDGPQALGSAGAGDGVLPAAEQLTQVLDPTGTVLLSLPPGAAPLLDAAQTGTASRGVQEVTTTGPDGQPTSLVAGPVTTPEGRSVVVVVGASLALNRQAVLEARELLLLAAVPAALVGGLGAWLLAGAALRPVERVRREAEGIRVRDDDVGLWVPRTGDEVERLTRTLDALVRQLHGALRHRQDQLADVAHELRTPLGALTGELELLEREQAAAGAPAPGLVAARASVERLTVLVERLLLLGAGDRGAALLQLVVCEPGDLVEEAVLRAGRAADSAGVRVRAAAGSALPALVCDRTRVGQILDNLVGNALAVVPAGGRVEVSARAVGAEVLLEVTDDGPGFGDVPLEEVFTRFRRGDVPRRPGDSGMGLGLAIVRELARAHGGEATAARAATGGAVVTVRLPAAGPSDRVLDPQRG